MAKWVIRSNVSEWYNGAFKSSSIVHITGLLGVGKTAETRHYLKTHVKKIIKWHTCVKSLDIASILGFEGQGVESALLQASKSWNDKTLCVWDDVQLLKPNIQYALIQFLKNESSQAQHILISEENLAHFLGYETPVLVLSGLSLDQVKSYITDESTKWEAETLYQKTKGNLLLLQVGLRTGQFQLNISTSTAGLSSEGQQVLTVLALLPEGISSHQLNHFSWSTEILEELQRKHLVTFDEDRYRVTAFPYQALENFLTTQDLKSAVDLILKNRSHLNLSRFSQWRLLIRAPDSNDSENFPIVEPSEIENIPVDILENDLKLMESLKFKANSKIESQKLRLQLASLIYQGDRKPAMKWLDSLNLTWNERTPEHRLWFIFDTVYWRNRSGEIEKASLTASQMVNSVQIPLKQFLQIEMALPFVEIDPPRALETLQRVQTQLLQIPDSNIRIELQASTEYQLATCYFNQQSYQNSLTHYTHSRDLYESLQKRYFAAFALLNAAWCQYHLRQWQNFENGIQELKSIVVQFGYRYLSVGIDLLEGLLAFENVRESDALRMISLAEHQTRKFNMKKPWQDAALEKAKVLVTSGHFQKAQNLITELKPQIPKNDPRQKIMTVLERYESLTQEDLRDLFPDQSQMNDSFLRKYLRLREITGPEIGELSLRDQLIECEVALKQAARQKQKSDYQSQSLRLGSCLENIQEPRLERVGFYCVQSLLQNSQEEKQHLLEMAELELERIVSDSADKKALNLWIQALRKGEDLKNQKNLKNLPLFTQNRWLYWELLSEENQAAYTLVTPEGSTLSEEQPEQLKTGLTVDETRGEVFWKKKKITEFSKKPVLRQILIRLLEAFPGSLSKPALASSVWGESYSPLVHDSRIYTSVQRIRQLISSSTVENWSLGYRLQPDLDFILIRSTQPQARVEDRTQSLVLQALRKRKNWMKKSELLEATDTTDSTLKRALSALLEENHIERQGAGPAVQYRLK